MLAMRSRRFYAVAVAIVGLSSASSASGGAPSASHFWKQTVDDSEVKFESSGLEKDSTNQLSAFELISEIRSFKSALNAVFDRVAYRLVQTHDTVEAEKVKTFANDYLSIFGWTKGITGLVKDFVTNYWGQRDFHDRNGPLLNYVRRIRTEVLHSHETMPAIASHMGSFSSLGMDLFDQDGGMHMLFEDVRALFADPKISKAFVNHQNIEDVHILKNVFEFFGKDFYGRNTQKKLNEMEMKELDEL